MEDEEEYLRVKFVRKTIVPKKISEKDMEESIK
jgi:hypothetical protein